jgi:succinoglycan biosynthesis protein ExoA
MPVRNEARHITESLQAVLAQDYPPHAMEVIVADGLSTDGTTETIQRLAAHDPRLRWVANPGKIVPTGLNAAIGLARGELIVRMDAHTEYAPDYIRQCVTTLQQTQAHNVGGPWRACGRTYLQKVIAAAFQSPFCSGGAGSHALEYEGAVDSVYLGCWQKTTLEAIGGFDEELVRNQDDELNLRMVRAGYRLWQTPRIQSWYYPRSSILALFRQYMQYGYWKVRVIQKHRLPASLRHLVPGAFVALLLLLTVLSPFSHMARIGLAAVLGSYLLANLAASLHVAVRQGGWNYLPALPLVFMAYHFGYGYGFLRGLVDFGLRRAPATQFSRLTRA